MNIPHHLLKRGDNEAHHNPLLFTCDDTSLIMVNKRSLEVPL